MNMVEALREGKKGKGRLVRGPWVNSEWVWEWNPDKKEFHIPGLIKYVPAKFDQLSLSEIMGKWTVLRRVQHTTHMALVPWNRG